MSLSTDRDRQDTVFWGSAIVTGVAVSAWVSVSIYNSPMLAKKGVQTLADKISKAAFAFCLSTMVAVPAGAVSGTIVQIGDLICNHDKYKNSALTVLGFQPQAKFSPGKLKAAKEQSDKEVQRNADALRAAQQRHDQQQREHAQRQAELSHRRQLEQNQYQWEQRRKADQRLRDDEMQHQMLWNNRRIGQ